MKSQKGFTLIELFVLLGIIAMIVMMIFSTPQLRIPFLVGVVLIIAIIVILIFIDRRWH